jgi:outer membrane protein
LKANILFFLFALAFSLTTNAQITKGNWLAGGNGNFVFSKAKSENSNGNVSTSKAFGFNLQPKIGYFPLDKFAVGLSLRLNHYNPSESNLSNWSSGIGPFLRYYFLPTDELVNVFSEVGYVFATDLKGSSFNSNSIGLKAGTVIFFTASVGLEVTLNYDYTKRNADSSKDLGNRFSLGIGFQVHLKKK